MAAKKTFSYQTRWLVLRFPIPHMKLLRIVPSGVMHIHDPPFKFHLKILYVTCSVKRGLIADPNSTYLETRNLTCEYFTTLKLGPIIALAYHYCVV